MNGTDMVTPCCKVPAIISGSGEGTSCHVCPKCGEACDPVKLEEDRLVNILVTVHFLDGQTWEETHWNPPAFKESNEEFAKNQIGLMLEHKSWYQMPDNSFLPASRIAKATWKLVEQ